MIWVTNSNLIEQARKEAKICLETGETERPIPFGEKGLIFVSTNPDTIVPIEHFELCGKDFFLGMKKAQNK